MWICSNCGEQIPDSKESCAFCDTPRIVRTDNRCVNPQCEAYNMDLNDLRKICPVCGELTSVGKKIKEML